MKSLKDYIVEQQQLEFLNEDEDLAVKIAVAAAFSAAYSSSKSRSGHDDDDKSTTGQLISGLLRCCGVITAVSLGSAFTGALVMTATIVLFILSIINIPYGKFIDNAIAAAKKHKNEVEEVEESLGENEFEYIDEGLKDKLQGLKEKVVKGFAKLLLKNKKIKSIVEDITKQDGYDDAKKSFESLSKFVFAYFKKEKDEATYKSIANDLKKDNEKIPE